MKRARIIAANWKMNKGPDEVKAFFREFHPQTESQLVFFVPALALQSTSEARAAAQAAMGHAQELPFEFGVQNYYFEDAGAFTGETSLFEAQKIGAEWALLGHSERRALFSESNETIAKKLAYALSRKAKVMLCVGETLAEREAGQTEKVLEKQLSILKDFKASLNPSNFVLAYEPVWAIGTGKVASPEQAAEAHKAARTILAAFVSTDFSNGVSILYGGSAKPENFAEIEKQEGIDGFLIGGASLKPDQLSKFC